MPYEAEISRANSTCFFFLIDQSSSMTEPIMNVQGNPPKAIFIADIINKIIQNLIVTASQDLEVRRYYQIGGLGYSSTINPVFGSQFSEQELIWVDDLSKKPIRIEDREKIESDGAGGIIRVPAKFPIWIDPIANGGTRMCEAMSKTLQILENWVNEHPLSYPPTVINFTDGEANDGDPLEIAKKITELKTNDGNVLLFTLHASSNPYSNTIMCPNVDEVLPDAPSKAMFEMSSKLTVR